MAKDNLIERLSTKPAMRLFVGFGIVGAFILMYPVIVACAIAGWITVAEAKELVDLDYPRYACGHGRRLPVLDARSYPPIRLASELGSPASSPAIPPRLLVFWS